MAVTKAQTEDPHLVARELAGAFALTAVERDAEGGTPKAERDQIRESGLLLLRVPKEFGGLGADWTTVLQTVRIIAEADASLAHVFGYHHLQVVTPHLLGTVEQRTRYTKGRSDMAGFGLTHSTRGTGACSWSHAGVPVG